MPFCIYGEKGSCQSSATKMILPKKSLILIQILRFLVLYFHHQPCSLAIDEYEFVVKEATYTRLCSTKKILTVNGQFPGPTIEAQHGDTIYVNVYNQGKQNITIHWHGVLQPRYPWADGPEYITQCPIKPGGRFRQKIIFSTEEGTLWWHAHSDWSRATVYGAIIIHPKVGTRYPFPKPDAEVPIILGEWWKEDITKVLQQMHDAGGDPNISDAFTINGQPGDLYPCSKQGTFKLTVDRGKTYLLRLINAAMNIILFFAIKKHNLTVVGVDAGYTKPLSSEYVTISPGQTIDALLSANQKPDRYYMVARAYSTGSNHHFDNTTTTAIVQYKGKYSNPTSSSSSSSLPSLPFYNDTNAAFSFLGGLKSLADKKHPIDVPLHIRNRIFTTISVNSFPCRDNNTCAGPNGTRFAASMNNISFVNPSTALLQAYYQHTNGVYGDNFPDMPPFLFNFTDIFLPLNLETPKRGTEVMVLDYNTTVEIVLQGTALMGGIDHPIHLHGYNFYIVGFGLGNFDIYKDPVKYNLKDPPLRNTVSVPINGWVTVRFKADNPGVWLLHCHIDRHMTWGMKTVFIVKDGDQPEERLLPPPPDMPRC
ncbi:laccase-15 [Gossypium hirsutum]|uniref:Laccase n=2 Tax=Gossypium TaxID=3633 RepID=A0ABM3BLT9_GOSHI|nr:laccase-15-like [Gossypium hirsutum]